MGLHCSGFFCCRAQALAHVGFSGCGSQVLEHRLHSGGAQAPLLYGMWHFPRPGIETVPPALTGQFFTTEPPGKPCPILWIHDRTCFSLGSAFAWNHGFFRGWGNSGLPWKLFLAPEPLACPFVGGSPVLFFIFSPPEFWHFHISGEKVPKLFMAQINFETISELHNWEKWEVVILFALKVSFFSWFCKHVPLCESLLVCFDWRRWLLLLAWHRQVPSLALVLLQFPSWRLFSSPGLMWNDPLPFAGSGSLCPPRSDKSQVSRGCRCAVCFDWKDQLDELGSSSSSSSFFFYFPSVVMRVCGITLSSLLRTDQPFIHAHPQPTLTYQWILSYSLSPLHTHTPYFKLFFCFSELLRLYVRWTQRSSGAQIWLFSSFFLFS